MIPLYKGIAQKSTIILVDFIQYNVVLFVQNLQYKIKKFQHITKMHVLCLITDEKITGVREKNRNKYYANCAENGKV